MSPAAPLYAQTTLGGIEVAASTRRTEQEDGIFTPKHVALRPTYCPRSRRLAVILTEEHEPDEDIWEIRWGGGE